MKNLRESIQSCGGCKHVVFVDHGGRSAIGCNVDGGCPNLEPYVSEVNGKTTHFASGPDAMAWALARRVTVEQVCDFYEQRT